MTEAKPKARKQHRCCECGGLIMEGEYYVRVSGIWDGEPARYKVCIDCDALRAEADQSVQYTDEMTPFGYLAETLSEMGDEELNEKFNAVKAKRKPTFKTEGEYATWAAQFL